MSSLSIIKNQRFKSNLFSKNSCCLFISYIDLNTVKLFEFRIFLKHNKITFNRLNTKQINKLIGLSLYNDVVFKNNNKNVDLTSINLSIIFLNNFYSLIYFLNYLYQFYKNKIYCLYLKINQSFFTINFLKKIYKNLFIQTFKELTPLELRCFITYNAFLNVNNLKIINFKLFLFFKIIIFLKLTNIIYQKIII
jgi:hypothetical protein